MKSKYDTDKLARIVLEEVGDIWPLVKAGYVSEEVAYSLIKIARDAKRMKDWEKQRNRAINESLILLASIEEDFFPISPHTYTEWIKEKYSQYDIEENAIAYPIKHKIDIGEDEEPWV